MPKILPVSRRILIKKLRALGFVGPYSGGRHEYLEKGSHVIIIPNPHGKDIGIPLIRQIIHQLDIDVERFQSL